MQAVGTFIYECLRLLWMVFFRPKSLRQEVERFDRRRRRRLVAQAFVTTTVTPFLLTILTGLLLEAVGIPFDFAERLSALVVGVVGVVVVGVIGGMAFGVAKSIAFGVAFGVVVGVAFGVAVGVVGGMAFGVIAVVTVNAPFSMTGMAAVVTASMAANVAAGVAAGVAVGVTFVVVVSVVAAVVAVGVALGVVAGVAAGVMGGVAEGVAFGVAAGVAFGIASLVGYFRLFLLPIEVPTTLWALLRARRQPQRAAQFLYQSFAYWDEVILLPQPFLTSLLVLVGEQDRDELLRAATHLTTNTFQQQVAVNALLELMRLDLLHCYTLDEIAQVQQNLGWLTPHLSMVHEVHISRHLVVSGSVTVESQGEVINQSSPRVPPAGRATTTVGKRPSGMLPVDTIEAFRKGGAMAAIERCQQVSAEVAAALSATSNYQKLTALNRARRQLDDLRQFAVIGLRGRESRVFAQVAQQWLDAVNAEIDRLTEEERVAERIPNPYVAPRPLSPDRDVVFVGRTEVFRFIEERFLQADQNVPIVLHGQPRIGKSSILRHFATHLSTNLISVYVDMQRAAQVESTSGLLFNLADTIGQELTRRSVRLTVPSLSDYAAEPFIIFGKFLDTVENAIHAPENRVILALDEFEEIERKLAEGKVSQDLMPFLRNMMQHRQGIALLFAGTHTLDEMIQDYWIPYFRSAVPCKVSYLNEADARKLITNPIEDFPLNYEPEAVEQLMAATRCHPCLIQLACSALVDLKNERRSHYASVEDLEQALTKALETGDYVFRGVWEWVPPHERAVLSVLAPERQATVEQLTRSLRPPTEGVQRMVKWLIEVEIIEVMSDDGGQPTYRFQVELFRQWVERHTARAGVWLGQPRS